MSLIHVRVGTAAELVVAEAIIDDLAGQVQGEVSRRQKAELAVELCESEIRLLSRELVNTADDLERSRLYAQSLNARIIAGGMRG